jgi:hypothetical protein
MAADRARPGNMQAVATGVAPAAVVVPVPEAEPAVGPWRQQLDPSARKGMPAHCTLVYPFAPHGGITDEVIDGLSSVCSEIEPDPATLVELEADLSAQLPIYADLSEACSTHSSMTTGALPSGSRLRAQGSWRRRCIGSTDAPRLAVRTRASSNSSFRDA